MASAMSPYFSLYPRFYILASENITTPKYATDPHLAALQGTIVDLVQFFPDPELRNRLK